MYQPDVITPKNVFKLYLDLFYKYKQILIRFIYTEMKGLQWFLILR